MTPLYVILLANNKERVEHVNRHLIPSIDKKLFDIQVFPANDFRSGHFFDDLNESPVFFDSTYLQDCLAGKIACTVSHLNVWLDIVKKNHNIALVVEDDAKLLDNFDRDIPHIFDELNEHPGWEMVYLHVFEKQYRKIEAENYLSKAYPTYCKCGYMLSQRGARRLLKFHSTINLTGDKILRRLVEKNMLNTLIVNNMAIGTAGQAERTYKNESLTSNIWGSPKLIDVLAEETGRSTENIIDQLARAKSRALVVYSKMLRRFLGTLPAKIR
jgi:GR25 family glycosyltransferase involved in LPS biosynthesis